jgi:prepilin-type N-terminal cleavage/methylation domain-containing protein
MADGGKPLRSRAEADDGFSLIELLIVMTIFSLVLGIVFSAIITIQRYTSDVASTADAASEVRIALAEIDRQVRSGNVLYSPAGEQAQLASCASNSMDAGSCMRVYTQANGSDRCVQWQVLADPSRPGTSLLRSRGWPSTWKTGESYSDWRTQARNLVPTTSAAWPFTLKGAANATSSRFLAVQFLAIDKRRAGGSVAIASSLAGRNTSYGYDNGLCNPAPPSVS